MVYIIFFNFQPWPDTSLQSLNFHFRTPDTKPVFPQQSVSSSLLLEVKLMFYYCAIIQNPFSFNPAPRDADNPLGNTFCCDLSYLCPLVRRWNKVDNTWDWLHLILNNSVGFLPEISAIGKIRLNCQQNNCNFQDSLIKWRMTGVDFEIGYVTPN